MENVTDDMRILAIGCFHGEFPKRLKRYVKKNNVDLIFALGDYPEWRARPYWQRVRKKIDQYKGAKKDIESLPTVEGIVGKKRMKRWHKLDLEDGINILKRLDGLGVPVYTIHGNHDHSKKNPDTDRNSKYLLEKLVKRTKNVKFLDYRTLRLDSFDFVFYGAKYPNVWKGLKGTKRRRKVKFRNKHKVKLLKLVKTNAIIVTHQPPWMTRLDRVNDKKVPGYGHHFGDDVLKDVIKRKQPALVLCAHFHENQGMQKIGKTNVVCAGYGAKGQAALVELGAKPRVCLVRI